MKTFCVFLFSLLLSTTAFAGEKLRIYAASSMTNATNALIEGFQKKHPVDITPVYASTSSLVRQIERGAPADIFISANEAWMDYLIDSSIVLSDGVTSLCENELVLIAPNDSSLDPQINLNQSFDIQSKDEWKKNLLGERLAIGNVKSVPAGIYAKEALESLKVWSDVERHLAPTNNVRMALALVERGEAAMGVVYKTDAILSDQVQIIATFSQDSHSAIRYPVAKISNSKMAKNFYAYLNSSEAISILNSFGFKTLK
ncbi:molybdate ABC transporter substrate-binding protein [Vibrio kagoshimensis]|uniref:molybdate ABC transporter substrate-binding protein n=1 Tax=Vibrio kagoshimensis TaxID=2910244 RepID=UPI003D2073FA